jgi:hypothetical protein
MAAWLNLDDVQVFGRGALASALSGELGELG